MFILIVFIILLIEMYFVKKSIMYEVVRLMNKLIMFIVDMMIVVINKIIGKIFL